MATTQTINAILDAVETTLEADSTLVALLGNSSDSILQYSKAEDIYNAMLNNPQARSPGLWIFYDRASWLNTGNVHQRTLTFFVDVVVFNPQGQEARENTAYPIIDRIYTTLIESQLSLANPTVDPVAPISDRYVAEVVDSVGNPLEISQWRIEFQTAVEWQK